MCIHERQHTCNNPQENDVHIFWQTIRRNTAHTQTCIQHVHTSYARNTHSRTQTCTKCSFLHAQMVSNSSGSLTFHKEPIRLQMARIAQQTRLGSDSFAVLSGPRNQWRGVSLCVTRQTDALPHLDRHVLRAF